MEMLSFPNSEGPRQNNYMTTQKLTRPIIEAAILGFESQREKLAEQIAELRALLDGRPTEADAPTEPGKRKRRKMSAAARKRIGDAQRKRWAASKKPSASPSEKVAVKRKRKMSAAGRKAISEATKKRWAMKRAEGAKTKNPAKKPAKKRATKKVAAETGAQ